MTLITAIIGGLACGYFLSMRRKAFLVWLAIWAAVLTVEKVFLLDPDVVDDWDYWPVQAVILVGAIVMIRQGAALHGRLSRRVARC